MTESVRYKRSEWRKKEVWIEKRPESYVKRRLRRAELIVCEEDRALSLVRHDCSPSAFLNRFNLCYILEVKPYYG